MTNWVVRATKNQAVVLNQNVPHFAYKLHFLLFYIFMRPKTKTKNRTKQNKIVAIRVSIKESLLMLFLELRLSPSYVVEQNKKSLMNKCVSCYFIRSSIRNYHLCLFQVPKFVFNFPLSFFFSLKKLVYEMIDCSIDQ